MQGAACASQREPAQACCEEIGTAGCYGPRKRCCAKNFQRASRSLGQRLETLQGASERDLAQRSSRYFLEEMMQGDNAGILQSVTAHSSHTCSSPLAECALGSEFTRSMGTPRKCRPIGFFKDLRDAKDLCGHLGFWKYPRLTSFRVRAECLGKGIHASCFFRYPGLKPDQARGVIN